MITTGASKARNASEMRKTIRHRSIRYVASTWLAVGLFFLQNLAYPQSQTPTFGTTVVVPFGLRGLVYFIPPGSRSLPVFSILDAVGTIYTPSLNVYPCPFNQGFPGVTNRFEWFAIDYTGRFWIDQPGPYQFALTSDDGAKLYIDGHLYIDNDGIHPPKSRMASVSLNGGIHRIRVSYFQGPPYYVALVLALAGPDGAWHAFSTDRFKPPSDPEQWKYGGQDDSSSSLTPFMDSGAPEKAQKAFVAGAAALADGKLKEAKKHLERATKVYPGYAQAWSALGQTWENEQNAEQARVAYERALTAHPDYLTASVRLANLNLVQGHDEDARRVTGRAIAAKHADDPLIYFYDAVANMHLKHFDAAEVSARRAIEFEMAGEAPQAEYLLGTLLGDEGDISGALEHLRKCLAITPHAKDSELVRARITDLERTTLPRVPK